MNETNLNLERWCVSHTFDVLENRTYDEQYGPKGPVSPALSQSRIEWNKQQHKRKAPTTLYRLEECIRIARGISREEDGGTAPCDKCGEEEEGEA